MATQNATNNLPWALIETQNVVSPVASVNFTTGITSAYSTYVLKFSSVLPSVNAQLVMQISINGGSTYISSGYASGINYNAYNSATLNNVSSSTGVLLSDTASLASSIGASGIVYCFNFNGGGSGLFVDFSGSVTFYGTVTTNTGYLGCQGPTNSTVNALTVFFNGGANISSGSVSLYGLQ